MPTAAAERFLEARRRAMLATGRRPPRRKKAPRWLDPRGAELTYRVGLTRFVNAMREEVRAVLLPRLPELVAEAAQQRPDSRLDRWADQLAELMSVVRLTLRRARTAAAEVVSGTEHNIDEHNRRQFRKTMRSVLGVEVFTAEPWLEDLAASFTHENVALIKSIEEESLQQVETLVQRSVATGRRHEQIAKDIEDRFGVAKKRARLIARDQTAKFNGNLTKLRQQGIGVSEYIWRTSEDERVRPSHRERNGQRFRWDQSPIPGEEINCRCTPEAVVDFEVPSP